MGKVNKVKVIDKVIHRVFNEGEIYTCNMLGEEIAKELIPDNFDKVGSMEAKAYQALTHRYFPSYEVIIKSLFDIEMNDIARDKDRCRTYCYWLSEHVDIDIMPSDISPRNEDLLEIFYDELGLSVFMPATAKYLRLKALNRLLDIELKLNKI